LTQSGRPSRIRRKDDEHFCEYRTKRLILGYYDAYAAGDLHTWLGPEEKREPQIHEDERPEGT